MTGQDKVCSETTHLYEQLAAVRAELDTMLKGWTAIQQALTEHAVQACIHGGSVRTVPEAQAAQELWRSKQ